LIIDAFDLHKGIGKHLNKVELERCKYFLAVGIKRYRIPRITFTERFIV
jgi:hypothetical protein